MTLFSDIDGINFNDTSHTFVCMLLFFPKCKYEGKNNLGHYPIISQMNTTKGNHEIRQKVYTKKNGYWLLFLVTEICFDKSIMNFLLQKRKKENNRIEGLFLSIYQFPQSTHVLRTFGLNYQSSFH